MALSMGMAGILVETGTAGAALAVTSSHFCSAERQFRFPLEYAGQRTPTSQWTVTGAGAALVEAQGEGIKIAAVTIGKMMDLGVKDINNMGAAMAPAAAETIKDFLNDTNTKPGDYQMILTGDLGAVGSSLLTELLLRDGIDISDYHKDCGCMIFDPETQPDTNAGGSGCGCSGSVVCSYIINQMKNGELNNVLFVGTGSLMSTVSVQQGESIPCIAHAVLLRR